jgi:hypothetical protein
MSIVFDPFSSNVIITKANFTLETTPLAEFIARAAFFIFRIKDLTFCLMFELVIFAEKTETEGALEYSSSMIPNASLALDTNSINKRTCTAMFRYTVPPVTHERFAMITDPAYYFDARNVICTVLDETSARRSVHAFRHSTTAANDGLLNMTAKIAECAVFL